VKAQALPDFFDMLKNFDESKAYLTKLYKYGVNRSDPHFWQIFDWFQSRLDAVDPLHTGLYDLNRYYYIARPGA
jgi:hypothetical protein